jgi:hypothetical protein
MPEAIDASHVDFFSGEQQAEDELQLRPRPPRSGSPRVGGQGRGDHATLVSADVGGAARGRVLFAPRDPERLMLRPADVADARVRIRREADGARLVPVQRDVADKAYSTLRSHNCPRES